MKNRLIGIYNGSEILTLLGLCFAVFGIFSTMNGNALYGVYCLMLAGMCDGLDGVVARRIKRDRDARFYGVELDSLVDVVSFGALPVVIGWSLSGGETVDILILMFFICCGVIRLAFFNTLTLSQGEAVKPEHFAGLPITTIAIILPLFYYFFEVVYSIDGLRYVFLVTGCMYITNFKIKKPGIAARIVLCIAGVAVIIWGFSVR